MGDRSVCPHSVQFIGWVISHLTKSALKYFHYLLMQRIAGILLDMILIISENCCPDPRLLQEVGDLNPG
jgi:hypothetical protein